MEKKRSALAIFRKVSMAEGISFILLMFIAMPLKYWADSPAMVKYVGWAHGVLFIAYVILALRAAIVCKWSFGRLAISIIASLLPFGPFVFDKSLKAEEAALS